MVDDLRFLVREDNSAVRLQYRNQNPDDKTWSEWFEVPIVVCDETGTPIDKPLTDGETENE